MAKNSKLIRMKIFLPACFLFTVFFSGSAFSQKKLTLAEAISQNLIRLEVDATGGHSGQSLALHFEKLTKKPLEIRVPAGQVFVAGDSTSQNLMAVREEIFDLKNEKTLLKIYGLCIEATDGSPYQKEKFSLGKMASGALLTVAEFISKNKLQANYNAQIAIWCVTNGRPVASIGHKGLLALTCQALGVPLPEYRIVEEPRRETVVNHVLPTVVHRPPAEVYKPFRVEGEFDFQSNTDRVVNVFVFNSAGEKVKTLFANHHFRAGRGKLKFVFETSKFPRGEYEVCLHDGEKVVKKIKVKY